MKGLHPAVVLAAILPALSLSLQSGHSVKSSNAGCPEGAVPWPAADTTDSTACQPFDDAYTAAVAFLRRSMPPIDRSDEVSLFGSPGGVDGLDVGVATLGVNLSLTAKSTLPWAADVPLDIFNDYVLPYASVNEARSNWRQLLHDELISIVSVGGNASSPNASLTIDDVAYLVNGYGGGNASVWKLFGREIKFRSSQTPLIFDPMSIINFGYASCTGVSILLVDALRSLGVPARVAGTPAWNQVPEHGNHNWIEVWRGADKGWGIIEALPAGSGESLGDPCTLWFCNKAKFSNATLVYATRFDRFNNDSIYPLAWDPANTDYPGVNRSAYYLSVCSQC